MKSIFSLLLSLIIFCSCSNKTTPTSAVNNLDSIPYFELDGKVIKNDALQSINANDIAIVNIYKDKEAVKRFGKQAKNGAVIISTKTFAVKSFESVFSSFSNDYKNVIRQFSEDEIQYIMNGRKLSDNYEGDLAVINKKYLKSIKIIPADELLKNYQVNDKKVGVIIKSKRPRNLYNSKKKF